LIAPINGMYGNLNSNDCAKLSYALQPKLTIPCHYGMFASHMGLPGEFFNIMTEKYPDNKFLIMTQGEKLVIE
jgi:L-ascorbate 6-phosphate lactonase